MSFLFNAGNHKKSNLTKTFNIVTKSYYSLSNIIKLIHTTPFIDHNTGKEQLKPPTPQQLKECGIIQPISTGNPQADQAIITKYNEQIEANREKFTKYTLQTALNEMFDLTPIPTNSDFALYSGILTQIRTTKADHIEISTEDHTKLTKLFSTPPKNPQLNKIAAFILECLDNAFVNSKK